MDHFGNSQEWLIDQFRKAYNIACFSDDPSTKVGAVVYSKKGIELTFGYNHLLVDLPEDTPREEKYLYVAHAEESAVNMAAENGLRLSGSFMVCPWAACHDCAKAIIQSGIVAVYVHGEAIDQTPERWKRSVNAAKKMFYDNGVAYIKVYGKIGDCENLFDGKIWYP